MVSSSSPLILNGQSPQVVLAKHGEWLYRVSKQVLDGVISNVPKHPVVMIQGGDERSGASLVLLDALV